MRVLELRCWSWTEAERSEQDREREREIEKEKERIEKENRREEQGLDGQMVLSLLLGPQGWLKKEYVQHSPVSSSRLTIGRERKIRDNVKRMEKNSKRLKEAGPAWTLIGEEAGDSTLPLSTISRICIEALTLQFTILSRPSSKNESGRRRRAVWKQQALLLEAVGAWIENGFSNSPG